MNFDERVAGIHEINHWVTDNMIALPCGPDTEAFDLVWKALRGPGQYQSYGGVGTSVALLPMYWYDEPI